MASSPLKSILHPRDEARMSLIEHLDELRSRIIKIGLVFVVAAVVSWFFVDQIFDFMVAPGGEELDGKLAFTSVTGPILTYLKLALYTGMMVALPVLFYQIWAFVAPAVGEVGRLFTYTLCGMASLLFVCGVAFGYFLVLPVALNVLIGWDPSRFTEVVTTDYYLSFVTRLLLAFGIAFEVPAATYVGAKLGLVDAAGMKRYRRHAIMVNAILAAVITPAEPFSMLLMIIPLILLYEASIVIAGRVNPAVEETLPEVLEDERREDEASDSDSSDSEGSEDEPVENHREPRDL